MTIEQLIEESKGNVKILDLLKYPELHDIEVKPVETVTSLPTWEFLNEPEKVWKWTWLLYTVANSMSVFRPEVEQIYRELISVNFEEA